MKEQRIRCLIQGNWFPIPGYADEDGPVTKANLERTAATSWRFVRLAHNRRYLQYADFSTRLENDPALEDLGEKVDLSVVSSVVSNVSAITTSQHSSSSALKDTKPAPPSMDTKITIHGHVASFTPSRPRTRSHSRGQAKVPSTPNAGGKRGHHGKKSSTGGGSGHSRTSPQHESVLLTLHPQTHTLASEWLDGLLMLLNQQPITAETNKLVNTVESYGVRIRLLNVKFDELGLYGGGGGGGGAQPRVKGDDGVEHWERGEVPSREGLDEDYYYDIGGM